MAVAALDFKLDTAVIRDWVTEAGEVALHYFRRVDPEWKGVADPVTVADREIERLLTGYIRAAYPDHSILGEEFGSETLHSEYLWTIDPIDGTRVYVEGLPTWSITLALLHRRVPIFGLVYMPLYDDWTYTEEDDVLQNGVSIRDRLATTWGADSYLLARSDAAASFDIGFERIMAFGSTACHMAYTARGASVATLTHDSYLWDIAAGVAILGKQGGEVRSLDGQPLDLQYRDLTRRIDGMWLAGHPAVVNRLQSLITPRAAPVQNPAW